MCNNDSYLIFQCLVNKQQNSNSADIFIQYLAKMTSVIVVKEMDTCLMNKSNSYMIIFILLGGLVSKTNCTNQREKNLFHALNYLHTQIDLHGFKNCYNLCHLPLSQCYYQVRTKWLPKVMRQSFGLDILCVLFNTFIRFFFSLLNLTNIPDALLNPIKVY